MAKPKHYSGLRSVTPSIGGRREARRGGQEAGPLEPKVAELIQLAAAATVPPKVRAQPRASSAEGRCDRDEIDHASCC